MKVILTISLSLWLLLRAGPIAGDVALRAAALAVRPWAPAQSVGMFEHLIATSGGLFDEQTLVHERDAAAIDAAREYADAGELDHASSMLERIDGKVRPTEAQALVQSLPRRREAMIEKQLASGDHQAALHQLALAAGSGGKPPELDPPTQTRLDAEARVQALRHYLTTGDVYAAARTLRSFPNQAPLPLRLRAEELMSGIVHASTQTYVRRREWPNAYRLLHGVLQELQPDAAVGLAGALAARDALDVGLFGRPTRCIVKISPALHVADPDALSPSTELVVQNAGKTPVTVTFAGAEGQREQATLAPGQEHAFVFAPGDFVQWLDAGPRGALTVMRLGGGSWRQVVVDDFDATLPKAQPSTRQERKPVRDSRVNGRGNA